MAWSAILTSHNPKLLGDFDIPGTTTSPNPNMDGWSWQLLYGDEFSFGTRNIIGNWNQNNF